MRGIAFWFFLTAALYLLAGMAWGIVMSASGDHSLTPAHAHLNLIGGVVMALSGVYYHLVPRAGSHWLAKWHFLLATVGVLAIVPGIVMAVTARGETLAKIGAMLTLLAMALFVSIILKFRASA